MHRSLLLQWRQAFNLFSIEDVGNEGTRAFQPDLLLYLLSVRIELRLSVLIQNRLLSFKSPVDDACSVFALANPRPDLAGLPERHPSWILISLHQQINDVSAVIFFPGSRVAWKSTLDSFPGTLPRGSPLLQLINQLFRNFLVKVLFLGHEFLLV